MFKIDLFKFDPLAYLLIAAVLALEIYTSFFRSSDTLRCPSEAICEAALAACRR